MPSTGVVKSSGSGFKVLRGVSKQGEFRNWAATVQTAPGKLLKPKSIGDVQDLLAQVCTETNMHAMHLGGYHRSHRRPALNGKCCYERGCSTRTSSQEGKIVRALSVLLCSSNREDESARRIKLLSKRVHMRFRSPVGLFWHGGFVALTCFSVLSKPRHKPSHPRTGAQL